MVLCAYCLRASELHMYMDTHSPFPSLPSSRFLFCIPKPFEIIGFVRGDLGSCLGYFVGCSKVQRCSKCVVAGAVISTLGKKRWEDQQFKVILGFIVSLRPASSPGDPVTSKQANRTRRCLLRTSKWTPHPQYTYTLKRGFYMNLT